MSRNSKNAKRIQAAREMGKQRKSGNKGPARTQAKHGKVRAWWQVCRDYAEFIKGKPKKSRKTEEAAEA